MGVSTKDAIIALVASTVSCLVASSGFVIGRSTNAFSAAPLRSPFRALFVLMLGVFCAVVTLPVGVTLLTYLQGKGVWQVMLTALWFAVSGMVLGYCYGPLFRYLTHAFPRRKR